MCSAHHANKAVLKAAWQQEWAPADLWWGLACLAPKGLFCTVSGQISSSGISMRRNWGCLASMWFRDSVEGRADKRRGCFLQGPVVIVIRYVACCVVHLQLVAIVTVTASWSWEQVTLLKQWGTYGHNQILVMFEGSKENIQDLWHQKDELFDSLVKWPFNYLTWQNS